jgi:hypothetical protein
MTQKIILTRIHVADYQKWNRAKRTTRGIMSFASWLIAIGFAGGLEGTEPVPSMTGAIIFLIISIVLVPSSTRKISLTKAEGATQ